MAAVAIVDYTSLQAAVADWLNRTDLVDQIPAFITLSTAQFNRELRLRDMMVRANATSNAENVLLPDDWLEHYSLQLAEGTPGGPLLYVSERESNDIKALNPGGGSVEGYTIIGNMIELVPAPGDNVDLRMVYYARIPDLSATVPTNWLLQKSPDLYLYSTLMQSAPYLKEDTRAVAWSQLRQALIEGMRLESERSLRPTAGYLVARARSLY